MADVLPRGRAPGTRVLLALAVYVAVIAATPLLHHDLACHQRSPGHCQACFASPAASRTAEGTELSAPRLPDAGGIESSPPRVSRRHTTAPSPGRSPPPAPLVA